MVAILSVLMCAAVAVPVDVEMLDGRAVTGALVSLDASTVVIQTSKGLVSLPVGDVEAVSFRQASETVGSVPEAWVELVDGSLLAARDYEVQGDQARMTLTLGARIELPVRNIRSVRFEASRSPSRSWTRIRQARADSDRIVIRKKDRIDSVDGVFGDVRKDAVDFRLDGDLISVRHAKVVGLIYYHRRPAHPQVATVRVTDRHGSVVSGAGWKSDTKGLTLRLHSGDELAFRWNDVVRIDFALDRVVYLDQLAAQSTVWQDFWPRLADGEVAGQVARLHKVRTAGTEGGPESPKTRLLLWEVIEGVGREVSYTRGLKVPSRTSLVYRLPEGARFFRARVGIDARTREHGHVRLVMRGDGIELWAEDIVGENPPREIVVPLDKVARFEIVVDYGENQDVGDWLNLCNARILK